MLSICVVTSQEVFNSLTQEEREALAIEWKDVVYQTTEINPEHVEVLWQSYADASSAPPLMINVDYVSGTIIHNFDMLSFFLCSEFVRAVFKDKAPQLRIRLREVWLVTDQVVEN